MYIRKFEKKQAKVACSPRDWTLRNHCHSHHHDYYHQNHHHYHCHHHHHHQYQCRTSQITKQMCSCDLILNLTEPFDVTHRFSSVQSLSHILLCDPVDHSTPGFPVHHQLPELTQTHVHWVGDAIQPSHPLLNPPPAFNLSQHQNLFQGVSSL